MMVSILALAAAVSGGVVASGAGVAILVGFVFFLIGFTGKKGRRPNYLTPDGIKVIGTLLVMAVFMALAYACTLTSGFLIRFNGMDPAFHIRARTEAAVYRIGLRCMVCRQLPVAAPVHS